MNNKINSNKVLGLSRYTMVILIAFFVSCSKDKDPSPMHNIDPDAVSVSLTKIYAPETGVRKLANHESAHLQSLHTEMARPTDRYWHYCLLGVCVRFAHLR